MASLTSRLSKLNPFSSAQHPAVDYEDEGGKLDATSMAGGGHAGRATHITRRHLRVSQALRAFLVREGVLTKLEAGLDHLDETTDELRALLDKPHIKVPASLTDRSYPLPNYFISSSHNTYLLAGQLYGSSSTEAYKSTLRNGARCVEIDAWDSDDKDEPKVTHGYTFTSKISFRSVCEAIRDVVDEEAVSLSDVQGRRAAPIMLSLENHCAAYGQQRLVAIMIGVFGDRLLSKAIRDKGTREQEGSGEHVTLSELGSKIAVIVEYHLTDEVESEDEESDSGEETEMKEARRHYKEKKKQHPATIIIPELAELGVYAQSVKPADNTWFGTFPVEDLPHHPLINISETGLRALMPDHAANIARYNSVHLQRVYPKGTRVTSANLQPVPFWGLGAHICALNWQTFGVSLQLNEALFSGTDGYVLKPEHLRAGGDPNIVHPKKKLRLYVAGASDVPAPPGRDANDIKPYLTCTLVQSDDLKNLPPKKKTSPYKMHKLSIVSKNDGPPPRDPIWDEVLEWTYHDNELVFLRFLIKSDDSFARNPIVAVGAVRLLYVQPGWNFIRMLDLQGHETRCCVLVKFEIHDAIV